MKFDIDAARKAGYSDAEIADHLGKQSGFDVAAARKAGYSDAELVTHLVGGAKPAKEEPQQAVPFAEAVFGRKGTLGYGLARGAKDVIDTGAELLASGFDKLAGTKEAERVAAMNKAGKEEYTGSATTASDVGRVVGNVASTIPLTGGLGSAVGAVPGLGKLGAAITSGGFKAGSVPTTLAGKAADMGIRTVGGGIQGAVAAGAVNPEDAGTGAAIGAALPAGVKAASAVGKATGGAVKSMLTPLSSKYDDLALGAFLKNQLGTFYDDAMNRLKASQEAGPTMLPGYQATPAGITRVPNMAALERTAIAVDPMARNQLSGVIGPQNQEIFRATLDELAGRGGARDFAKTEASATAQQLYKQAFEVPFDMSSLSTGLKGEMTKLMKMPAIQDAAKTARTNAANRGMKLNRPEGSVEGLHEMKMALDEAIKRADNQTGSQFAKSDALTAARDRLVKFIENISPEYAGARGTYAQMMRPVNEFDVFGKVAESAVRPGTGNVSLDALARASSDRTAQQASRGFVGKFEDLDAQSLARLNAVRNALADIQFAQTAGRGVGSDTVQKLATSGMFPGAQTLMRQIPGGGLVGGLVGRGADVLYGAANERMRSSLANALLDPAETLRLLQVRPGTNALGWLTPDIYGPAMRSIPVLSTQQ